ncbi:uncharacterized protein LOC126835922 [Adelges cooleyi]|uniref:uncharacterized protein LOC126835922 n=1 Tax=Adelges cooleyi TaxID=133065 RepID=UPI00217F9F73|nr:uncharacterized protein LOC126835922 [Adelges cooleyi]
MGTIACLICITIGPVLSAIHDIGKVPLDHRSHWIIHWPSVIHMESFWSYGFIFTLQVISSTYTLVSITLYNIYMIVFLTELKEQFNLLTSGIREAFNYRMDQHFQDYFVDCVRHHQTLIKALDEFKKFYKWILLGEIVAVQFIFSIVVYCLLKVDASFGYKLKFIGVLVIRLVMHKRLSTELYAMTWYHMPNQYKKMIIIMFQRTQRDLTINLAIFQNKVASRIMFLVIIKQFYTFLNVLLNI